MDEIKSVLTDELMQQIHDRANRLRREIGHDKITLAAALMRETERAVREATTQANAKPGAWVRFRSNGGIEGPLLDSSRDMCDIRRRSGAWTPLYAAQPQPATQEQAMDAANALISDTVLKYIDRMNDIDPVDPAEKIVAEFVAAVMPHIDARIAAQRMPPSPEAIDAEKL